MMSRKVRQEISRATLAGALVLLSQAAMSGEVQLATAAPEQVRVTLPRDWMELAAPSEMIVELTDKRAHFELVKKRVAQDIARQNETLGVSRTELAQAEVPTRG